MTQSRSLSGHAVQLSGSTVAWGDPSLMGQPEPLIQRPLVPAERAACHLLHLDPQARPGRFEEAKVSGDFTKFGRSLECPEILTFFEVLDTTDAYANRILEEARIHVEWVPRKAAVCLVRGGSNATEK